MFAKEEHDDERVMGALPPCSISRSLQEGTIARPLRHGCHHKWLLEIDLDCSLDLPLIARVDQVSNGPPNANRQEETP